MEMLRSLHQVSPLQSPLPVIGEPVLHAAGENAGVVSGAAEAVSRAAAEITATPVAEAVLLPVSGGNGDAYGLPIAFLVIIRAIRGLGGFVPGDRVWVMLWGEPTETRVSQVEGDVVHTGVGSFRRARVLGEIEVKVQVKEMV